VADGDCLFCRIAAGELPANVVYSDDEVMAFRDIAPRAPPLLGRMFAVIREVARRDGIAESGFRVVSNTGRDGGQTVDHLHFHVLGRRFMTWPPG
jgi:histidine triad (HIT) family protein